MMNDNVLILIGALVIVVNIITEVAKNVYTTLKTSKVINAFVLAISIILSIISYLFYNHSNGSVIDGYGIVTSIIIGFMVAYSAMFGFDKLIVYVEPLFKGGKK